MTSCNGKKSLPVICATAMLLILSHLTQCANQLGYAVKALTQVILR